MVKKSHYIVVSGSKESLEEVQKLIKTIKDAHLENFTDSRVLNDNTMVLVYDNRHEPRLENIRLITKDFADLIVTAFDSEELIIFSQGTVKAIN